MSKMKGLLAMAMMTAALAESFTGEPSKRRIIHEKDPDEERMRRNNSEYERNTKQGLKLFTYGENQLWARTQENADRKAKLRHWL